jgi:hypothetical protein
MAADASINRPRIRALHPNTSLNFQLTAGSPGGQLQWAGRKPLGPVTRLPRRSSGAGSGGSAFPRVRRRRTLTLVEPDNSLVVAGSAGDWAMSSPPDRRGDPVPVAASGGWCVHSDEGTQERDGISPVRQGSKAHVATT